MKRLWILILVLALGPSSRHLTYASTLAQAPPIYREEALALFGQMTPAERIGQLFVVSFKGSEVTDSGAIYTLITKNHLGGVLLLAENNNFTDQGSTINDTRLLIETVQELALTGQSSNVITTTVPADSAAGDPLADLPLLGPPVGIPLLVSTYHGGNGHSELQTGLTQLPSYLALGATWSTEQVDRVGEVAGSELAAVGINMLLGPSLDVLNNPSMIGSNAVGTNAFGGSSFWVGQLGKAYIQGVRRGSQGRMAVVATGFPGSGGSDRPVTEEIATVRKSFDQLRNSDLIPYLQAAGGEEGVDGLMTAHIRFQGFQGNIQANTPPVSLDPQAIDTLMGLPEFAAWQSRGGVVVSAPLGWPAVARYYNPDGSGFPHRQVAKDALLAGNDILVIDDFGVETLVNLQDTMTWFVERYETDLAFQTRVDEAVLQILTLKLRLYGGEFSLEQVTAIPADLEPVEIGRSQGAIYTVAQEAVTLLSPGLTELANRLPSAPAVDDKIVILTDVRERKQCPSCPTRYVIGHDTLSERMIALYGPEASGQISADQISSFDFAELTEFLAADFPIELPTPAPTATPTAEQNVTPTPGPTPEPDDLPVDFALQEALSEADWIIVALQDVTPGSTSAAFNRLLAERPSMLLGKNVIVFAFELPVYLDSTEVSRLTAYYGFYSSSNPFIDAAVQIVFRDLSPHGASPISIQSLGYDLDTATRPRADQLITLMLFDLQNQPLIPGDEPLGLEPGDTLRLRSGVILDQNGNPVPDGTIVQFTQEDRVSGFFDVIGEVLTKAGSATFDYVLEARPGQFRLRAAAGQANKSDEVDIAIAEGQEASVVVITPTPEPTSTPIATITLVPTATATVPATATPLPFTSADDPVPEPQLNILLSELQMMFSMLSGVMILVFISLWGTQPLHQRLKHLLWGMSLGLGGYIYLILGLPGLADRLPPWGNWLGLTVTVGFGLIGMAAAAVFDRSTLNKA